MADLEERGRSLEEQFFSKQSADQVAALRAKKERSEALAELKAVTGLTNEDVLGSLLDQGVNSASLTAFALVPLAHVAWADGTLDKDERYAIIRAANEDGVLEGTDGAKFLEEILAAQPAPAMMDSWEEFVAALKNSLGPDGFAAIAGDVSSRVRRVAEAAGGFLRIGSVSDAETQAIARVEAALS